MKGRRLVAALLAVGALALAVGPLAQAAGIAEVGWWTRRSGQQVSPGGFAVAADPTGAATVAALRVAVDDGVSSAILSLKEEHAVAADLASLRVCPTTAAWTVATGGAFDQRPMEECDTGSVDLQRGEDGSWGGDLTVLFAGKSGTVSVMVVPGPPVGSIGLNASTFDISFAAPTLVLVAAPSTTQAPPPPSSSAGPSATSRATTTTRASVTTTRSGAPTTATTRAMASNTRATPTTTRAPSPGTSVTPTATSAASAGTTLQPVVTSASPPVVAAPFSRPAGAPGSSKLPRVFAFIAVSVAAGAAAGLIHRVRSLFSFLR